MTAKKFSPCPVATTAEIIGNKWKLLILRDLQTGTKRFGELKKSLEGISQKVLTENLRSLENSGVILRTAYPEVPPKVEYQLTNLGIELKPTLLAMETWGKSYKEHIQNENNNKRCL